MLFEQTHIFFSILTVCGYLYAEGMLPYPSMIVFISEFLSFDKSYYVTQLNTLQSMAL